MNRGVLLLFAVAIATALAGCTRTQSERGIAPTWRELPADAVSVGSSTKAEILALLGPPSQVITHANGEIFYYLHERAETRGLVLVVYNTSQTNTDYDRAIFFFDEEGVLSEYSLSADAESAADESDGR